jgi:hypothetical protein
MQAPHIHKTFLLRGGLEYLHYGPASHSTRQKGNPVLRHTITGGHKYRDLVLQFFLGEGGVWSLA